MRHEDSSGRALPELAVEYTQRPVSGWGGLVSMVRFFDRLDVRGWLERALPDGRSSPNQIPVKEIALSLFATVLIGGHRFAHVERVRSDEVVKAAFRIRRMPSAMTLTRYFGGFVRAQVEHLSDVCASWLRSALRPIAAGEVIDLDSTIFERFGRQEGSLKGHNPRRHGRPSHHPLLAFLAEQKLVLNAWLRSGNSGTARGAEAFLAESLARLPAGYRVRALRADSGFFVSSFLDELERLDLPYVVAVRMNRLVRTTLLGVQQWQPFAPGLEVGETTYQAHRWQQPRRVVFVREELRERPEARGRRLFESPDYTYHLVVTSMQEPPEEIWRFYNGRAESENRIKELKHAYGCNGFCLSSFDGTEAVFRLNCLLFNLVAHFKEQILGDSAPQLPTLRDTIFVVGAIKGASGRRAVLRLGLRGQLRERFARLLERIHALPSTVMQLAQRIESPPLEPPRPWQPRRRTLAPGLPRPLLYGFN